MKIVVKVGMQSILSNESMPIESIMISLVGQIAELQQSGCQVILVSSGAVASGRRVAQEILEQDFGSSIGEKQVLASLGQHELMHIYAKMFKEHNILAAQLLLTKQDFHTRQHYLNIARLLREILERRNIVPIINENDSVAIEELMFTDNDELAGLIAAQVGAEKLIILSNVEGVYTGDPNDSNSQLIKVTDPQIGWPEVSAKKSVLGRGGMISKISIARKMSNLGITTHIANTNQPQVLCRIVKGENIGTVILPLQKKSSVKRWIAYSSELQKAGSIFINTCLYDILKENKRVISILPVGIIKHVGNFKKGDLIDIIAPNGSKIGVGIAKYDSIKLAEHLSEKDKPEFIHYDYLHIF